MADMSAGVRSALVRGVVGDGAGLELLTWIDELDLPDPEAALADPDGVEFPDRGDRVYAVLSSVAAAVTANTTPERWRAGWQVMARASDQSPDIAAMAARVLARIRPEGESAPPEAARFVPVLRDAGMV